MPGIQAVAECFNTKIITTMSHSKIAGAHHVDFVEEQAVEKAKEVVRIAIQAFKREILPRLISPPISSTK